MKKILGIILMIFCFLSNNFASTRDLDTVYEIKKNVFWDYLLTHPQLKYNILSSVPYNYIPTENTIYKLNGQVIIKSGPLLFIQIAQTGILFKFDKLEDSLLIFKRQDKTININYNVDATHFVFRNELYNYGGYGFWKSNGALRKFNKVDREWDIVPLNKEVISSQFNWFSESEGRIYVPYERAMNASIIGQDKGVRRFDSYYLDIAKREWVQLGTYSEELKEITNEDFLNGNAIRTKEGYLYLQNDQVWLFDFLHNRVYKSNKPDLNQFLTRRRLNLNLFIDDNNLYSYNFNEKKMDVFPFDISDFDLMPYPLWRKNNTTLWWMIGAVLFSLSLIGIFWFIKSSMQRKIRTAQLKMLKTKSIQQAFVGTELTLIELLLKANAKGQKVEIHQINHVLGIKDKNIGLQKKVRSDIMNTINEKYQFINQTDLQLINSVRKEEDKRFFEYFINPSEIKNIQKIIHADPS